jgi:hypothetical protein
MTPALWAKVHGATTHFPLALALCSGVFDGVGIALGDKPVARTLHAAGFWSLMVAAAGSIPAVFSGLALTKGDVLGHGALGWHHVFVWPAFALLVGSAAWRAAAGPAIGRGQLARYLFFVALVAASISIAGYWGGELLIAG